MQMMNYFSPFIGSNFIQLQELANETLKNAPNWFRSNGLLLNQGKAQNLIVRINSYVLTQNKLVKKTLYLEQNL